MRLMIALGVAMALAAALGGCGKRGDPVAPSVSRAAQTPEPEPTPAPTPAPGAQINPGSTQAPDAAVQD